MKGLADLHFDDDVAKGAWEATHPMGKRTYLTTEAPGVEVIELDSLHLAKDGQKRFQIIEEVHSVRRLAP